MASVSKVTLSIGAASPSGREVTVKGTLGFDASEVGKTFRLEIKILGEDKTGDKTPVDDPIGDDILYTYGWGSIFLKRAFKEITVASAGAQSFTESRVISEELLDEDSGLVKVAQADINTPVFMPRADEVYALVSLTSAPVSARSATVNSGLGV